MTRNCLKCGFERKKKKITIPYDLTILEPCPNCGATLNEEVAIADSQYSMIHKEEKYCGGEKVKFGKFGTEEKWLEVFAPKTIQAVRNQMKKDGINLLDVRVFVRKNKVGWYYPFIHVEIVNGYNNPNFNKIKDWLKKHIFEYSPHLRKRGGSWDRDLRTMIKRKNEVK